MKLKFLTSRLFTIVVSLVVITMSEPRKASCPHSFAFSLKMNLSRAFVKGKSTGVSRKYLWYSSLSPQRFKPDASRRGIPEILVIGSAPKSFLDELSHICGVCFEVRLLLVSNDFQRKSKTPDSKSKKVPHSKGRVQGGRVQGQGGQQRDKDPKTLNGPVDKELGRIVLDIVEPHVLSHFHHPIHQEGAKSSSPYTHQACGNSLAQTTRAPAV